MSAAELTARERQICSLVAEGLTNAQVGERLHLSHYTIKSHLQSIFRKLGVVGRAQLGAALTVKIRTSDDVVDILRALRADRAKETHLLFSPAFYRQEGELRVLDKLIEQIGAVEREPRMAGRA